MVVQWRFLKLKMLTLLSSYILTSGWKLAGNWQAFALNIFCCFPFYYILWIGNLVSQSRYFTFIMYMFQSRRIGMF